MNWQPRFIALAGMILMLGVTRAKAEADGFYCTDIGIIAFEMGVGGEHELHVLTFGGHSGIGENMRIPLTAFQTVSMRCSGGKVHLASETMVWSVDIARATLNGAPVKMQRIPTGKKLEGFVKSNLGSLAKKGKIELRSLDPVRRYELEIRREKKRTDGMLETSVVSSLVQKNGRTEERREVLYDQHFSAVDE